jgi:hypothetical protein
VEWYGDERDLKVALILQSHFIKNQIPSLARFTNKPKNFKKEGSRIDFEAQFNIKTNIHNYSASQLAEKWPHTMKCPVDISLCTSTKNAEGY